ISSGFLNISPSLRTQLPYTPLRGVKAWAATATPPQVSTACSQESASIFKSCVDRWELVTAGQIKEVYSCTACKLGKKPRKWAALPCPQAISTSLPRNIVTLPQRYPPSGMG